MTTLADLALVSFTVPGVAVGKQRQRANFAGKGGRLYTPSKTVNYEATVKLFAAAAMAGRPPIDETVDVEMTIVCPIAPSWSKTKRQQAHEGTIYPGSKPDGDNVEKSVFDGMNGTVWRDDVLVVTVFKRKRYGQTPGVTVTVYPGGAIEHAVLTTRGILA